MLRNFPATHLVEEETTDGGVNTGNLDNINIRQARLSDIPAMLRLINNYAAKSVMLPRTELEICESLRDFLIATDNDQLVGCGAIHFYTQHMAELRSLAVDP